MLVYLLLAVIPGRERSERARNPQPRSGVWIPGLRLTAHPGMTNGESDIFIAAQSLVETIHPRARTKKLPRRHADGAVEADGLAVQHRVLDDVHGEIAVFGRVAEPRWMRDLRA